jgi:hypothetical protein
MHFYFRHPSQSIRSSTPWHPELEFRAKGSLLVLPPSLHPSGAHYRWAVGQSIEEIGLPELPQMIKDHLLDGSMTNSSSYAVRPAQSVNQHPHRFSASTMRFLSGETSSLVGGRNKALFVAACEFAGKKINYETARKQLLAPIAFDPSFTQRACIATIRSAYVRMAERLED